ncbi:MAG: DUF6883 domain-containing protein [Thermodesulfovibrionales bacterium]
MRAWKQKLRCNDKDPFFNNEMLQDAVVRNIEVIGEAASPVGDVIEAISSLHGVKYIIDGLLTTPIGGSVKMRTVWIIDKGQERPRFVTAYPA